MNPLAEAHSSTIGLPIMSPMNASSSALAGTIQSSCTENPTDQPASAYFLSAPRKRALVIQVLPPRTPLA